tara:strand:+ start:1528 stop:6012 length:4485 start_codon:yes stop_codon:yes gene_type:complete
MKIDEVAGVGKIVKGVNTTVDVKPGETERQAKKFFGGTGKPKKLVSNKTVANSTPNKLFNLGLAEKQEKEELKGFDPRTAKAIQNLMVKFPQAKDPLAAIIADIEDSQEISKAEDKHHRQRNVQQDKQIIDITKRLEKLEKTQQQQPVAEEDDEDMSIIQRAEKFAQEAHKDHKRKYTGDPYYVHLDEVRRIVKSAGGSENMQAAALLHDTVEDTATTSQDIMKEFGPAIAKLVVELTDISKPEDGNRATRKAMDRDKLAGASADAQTIKYADLISNGRDIGVNDPKFAKVYHKEKADLLRVMRKGNQNLRNAAIDMLPDELRTIATENLSYTGTERRRLEKKKGIEVGTPEWFKHWFDLPYLREGEAITYDELVKKAKYKSSVPFYINNMLRTLHSLVSSGGKRHSLGYYAQEVGRQFGFSGRDLEKLYRQEYNTPETGLYKRFSEQQLDENPIIANIMRAIASRGYKVAKDVVTAWYKNAPPGLTPEQAADAVIKTGIGVGGIIKATSKKDVDEGKRIARKKGQKANSKKHSDLYTDENPKGTIHGLKFATVKDAEASVRKIKSSGKKHAHKIQAAIAMEQRAKAAGKKSAAAVYRRYINAMKKKTKKMNESTIQKVDIKQLETFADKLFGKVGIDVEFTKHFMDRVNDVRNQKPITMSELTRLFKQEYKRWGRPIAQLGPDSEAVMKDLQTDINLPFVLKWDSKNKELDLVAKTVMRKADFKTNDREFPVENVPSTNKPGTIGQYINWAGKNNPKNKNSNVYVARKSDKLQPQNWWQSMLQKGKNLFDGIESYTDPNFEVEWDEAKRYPEFVKIGKDAWIELAKSGKPIDVDNELANKIENTEAGEENRHEFDNLEKPKKERFRKAVEAGTVELPIIARYSDGYLELVAGNTRLTGMMNEFGSGKAWIFDVPDKIAVLGESEQLDLKKKFEITDELKQLDSIFKKGKHEIRIVGGAVRDLALGKAPKDIDLATDATPQEMQRMFDSAGIKHLPTGIEHGTITAVLNGDPYEITTLRADVETDGRRAEVEFVRSWEEDAKRRDLTYNAMSMDFEGNLYDYHGGMDDLQDKVTRFVGDPEERIKEDYLRTLRYFRFQGRLDTPTFDRATMNAIASNIDGLKQLSVERVWMEMSKILSGSNIQQILGAMQKTGVLDAIGLNAKSSQGLMDGGDPIINLARITDDASIGQRWKMSNEEKSKLGFLIAEKGKTHDKKWYTDQMVDGFDRTQLDALARYNNQDDMIQYIKTFKAPEFPVDGNDLIKIGHERGPGIGKTLMALRNKWKQGNFSASKDELLQTMNEKLQEDTSIPKYLYKWVDMPQFQKYIDAKKLPLKRGYAHYIESIDDFVKGNSFTDEQHISSWEGNTLIRIDSSTINNKIYPIAGNRTYLQTMHMKNPSVYDDAYLYEPEEIDEYWIAGPVDLSSVEIVKMDSVDENFADGKKKGKSRPGRVKRAGASCKGSVTDLRRKAKNSSGEKAKMYHWCANMKSGKNKSK